MKKIAAILLALFLMATLSMTAFADEFLESPSLNPAPEVTGFEVDSPNCNAHLELVPFAEREKLSPEELAELMEAYYEIRQSDDLTDLSDALEKLDEDLGIPHDQLAVSDLFDLHYTGCDHGTHLAEHGSFTIRLRSASFHNFVALIHFDGENWSVIQNASVDENDIMTFRANDFSPFAVVVRVDAEPDAPDTSDKSMTYLWGVLAAVSAMAVAVCVFKARRSAK